MKLNVKIEEVLEILSKVSKCSVSESKKNYIFTFNKNDNYKFTISKKKLQEELNILKSFENNEGTTIYNDTYCEVLIREESPYQFRRFREEKFEVKDKENKIIYELSKPSDFYILWLSIKIYQDPFIIKDMMGVGFSIMISPILERAFKDKKEKSIFDFLRIILSRFKTLKIISEENINYQLFNKLINAFLFQLGYNLDVALIPLKSPEELIRHGRLTILRRAKKDEIAPPRRLYDENLIHHYLSAISTDNPIVEFLSYYHILEYFFESVFNDELIENTRLLITHPSFSYKRKKDINKLIKSIKDSLRIRSERITFSEMEALKLCLKKYINLQTLVELIEQYDRNLLEYYKSKKVPFSNGNQVDLNHTEHEQIYINLTKRIYLTRNALVHSKESENNKFTPFSDNTALLKELPLMRFIAENVILKESKVLK